MNCTPDTGVPNCLKDYLLVDTQSMERAHDAAARSFVPHKLMPVRRSANFRFVHSHATLQNISLCYTSYGSELVIEPESMEEFYLIQIPVNGTVFVESGGRQCDASDMYGSIVSPMNRTKFHWSDDSGLVTMKIERQALEEQLSRLRQAEVRTGIEFDIGMSLAEPQYKNWCIEIVRLMQYFQFEERTELVSLESWFEQKLMEILLTSQPSNYSEELTMSHFRAPSKSVGLAIDYMHAHMDEKITLAGLASVTGVTARTLHNGFKRFRNVSPLEYLNDIRLQKARSDLQTNNDQRNVTSIAQSAGFSHLGRFSQQYYRQFGERPSETLKKHFENTC